MSSGNLTGWARLMRVFNELIESSSIDAADVSPCAASADALPLWSTGHFHKGKVRIERQCRAALPDSAFSLWMSIPKRQARLDRGAQFSNERESDSFLKLSPKPAWTTHLCLFLLLCSFETASLLQSAPVIGHSNIPTAALTLCCRSSMTAQTAQRCRVLIVGQLSLKS